ncbi:peroxisomal succinyl-coenzyme A thioesterase-like [Limanda limanda]|uniref:peroxisomal succinyl-coenzyme A thioesterase-like n=1 Tax=Limanda limanda TaxID=27771 RepID=UPI0029C6483A|nr:peroxisomal succinyl-coenzyme A thioesterase-like [Limanda limanda]
MDRKQCCVSLSVQPSRGQMDEKFIVLIQNAPPGFQLTVHAFHQCEDKFKWEAFGHYTADATGTVNVSEDLSLGGTYLGVEPMGLLWSLTPVPGSKPGLMIRKLNVQTPMEVTISVYQDHQTEGFVDLVSLASVLVERWHMAPGIRRIPITEDGLSATLFLPPGPGPFPGILDLLGSGGMLLEYRSALFACHGFASLALDYLTNKVSIETGNFVDNKYFESAYNVLQQHPQVLGSRIAMVGLSLGCAITFKMAVYSDVFKPPDFIIYTPGKLSFSSSIPPTLRAMLNTGKTRVNEENQIIFRDLLLPITTDTSFKADVGRLQCPLLLVVGEDDQNWPAYESAMDIKEMMEGAGNSHLLTVLSYPNTGHIIEPPFTPHTRASNFMFAASRHKSTCLWGGEKVAHSHAQEDAWRKMLLFLRKNLWAMPELHGYKVVMGPSGAPLGLTWVNQVQHISVMTRLSRRTCTDHLRALSALAVLRVIASSFPLLQWIETLDPRVYIHADDLTEISADLPHGVLSRPVYPSAEDLPESPRTCLSVLSYINKLP